jgi:transposase
MISAHRYAYIKNKGEITVGMKVCHTCNNPGCVNPDHLFLDTHHNNMKRMKENGRLAKGSAHGTSKLDEAKVKNIRKLYREGFSKSEIAKIYKVTPVTIAKVISGKSWGHVTE